MVLYIRYIKATVLDIIQQLYMDTKCVILAAEDLMEYFQDEWQS